jgi:gamma-butyrobetaine dioxygenase
MHTVDVSQDGQIVTLSSALNGTLNGTRSQTRFHAIWLRDNAMDAGTRSLDNGQSLIAIRDIPRDILVSQGQLNGDLLQLTFMPTKQTIDYSVDWLLANAYDKPQPSTVGWAQDDHSLWGNDLMANLPVGDYDQVFASPVALQTWLGHIARYGFATLEQGPVEAGTLTKVVDLFGHVRETNYGRMFEVRVEEKPTNLAFTGMALQAHTDNPYRAPTPSIQVLYCLESSVPGGDSILVDGFKAVTRLRQENPHGFDLLSRYCARFEYAGEDDVCLQAKRPMIELAPDGQLQAVRFNNRSSVAFTDIPFEHMAEYYVAYRRLGEIIDDPDMEISFRLNPGDCVVMDNTRVLHARKAFSGAGTRWLQGCYSDMDGLLSRLAVLNRSLGTQQPNLQEAV